MSLLTRTVEPPVPRASTQPIRKISRPGSAELQETLGTLGAKFQQYSREDEGESLGRFSLLVLAVWSSPALDPIALQSLVGGSPLSVLRVPIRIGPFRLTGD